MSRRSALPPCAYCDRPGLGDPPLCRAHFEQAHYGPGLDDEDPVMDVFDRLFEHPRVQQWVGTLGDRLEALLADKLERRKQEFYVGPHNGYRSEWPPPPPGGRPRSAPRPGAPPPPPPPAPRPSVDEARVVLGFPPTGALTVAQVKKRQRELAAIVHPDKGGSEEAMTRVNAAADLLISVSE
jgi:hypothetical protein